MVNWNCDCCGLSTHIHPPTEPIFEEKEVEVDVPQMTEVDAPILDKHGNPTGKTQKQPGVKIVKQLQKVKLPKMIKVKRQNIHTRSIEEIEVQEHRDLTPRAFMVRLSFGMTEEVQRDFCRECLNKFMPKFKETWDLLEGIVPK